MPLTVIAEISARFRIEGFVLLLAVGVCTGASVPARQGVSWNSSSSKATYSAVPSITVQIMSTPGVPVVALTPSHLNYLTVSYVLLTGSSCRNRLNS